MSNPPKSIRRSPMEAYLESPPPAFIAGSTIGGMIAILLIFLLGAL